MRAVSDDVGPGQVRVSTRRAFWWTFAAAWLAYAGLFCSVVTLEGYSLRDALLPALGSTVAPVIPAWVLAVRRRDLLRPERTLGQTARLHVLVAVGFGVCTTLLALALGSVLQITPFRPDASPGVLAGAVFANALFLYAVLAGFLMWSESAVRFQEGRALIAQAAALRADAEAKALRAQLNPHFIFNTLHSMILLVRADPDGAERAIEDVASLIRYASDLHKRGVDTVPLQVEIQMAERYLGLEQLRLGDRLSVEWHVEPGLERIELPALTLQTLLENAVKHGISSSEEGGRVSVGIREDAGEILIRVEDDGSGALASDVDRSTDSGIQLLRRRLATIHGSEASLTWRTAPEEGFSAEVRLPAPAGYGRDGTTSRETDPSPASASA